MKQGRTLTDLAAEIERRAAAKKDFIAPPEQLRMTSHDRELNKPGVPQLWVGRDNCFDVTNFAHEQIAEYLKIPQPYYKRMIDEAPELLARNVNEWFAKGDPKKKNRMVRVLDGKVRALLSDGYRRMENEDLAEAVLPILADLKLDIMSCEITDRRLYIKAVDPAMTREIQAKFPGAYWGDGGHHVVKMREACPAITIANSEIGEGRLSVLGGLYDGGCTNLATFGERSVQKTHLGKRHELGGEELLWEILSDKTKQVTDEALWRQVQDTVRATFNRLKFDALVDKVDATQAEPIDGDPIKVVTATAKKFGLDGSQERSVLRHLIEGGSLSRFGLYNAVTRASQDVEDYDEASRMERLGGKLIELPQTEWRALAKAA
jgi:hypothetical protein